MIQDVAPNALISNFNGASYPCVPGMVLNGVAGHPVGGRTFHDVMAMLQQAVYIASIAAQEQADRLEAEASREVSPNVFNRFSTVFRPFFN